MKNDLIRRQDVLHELDGCDYELKDWQRWKLKTMVRDIPSAEPERKTGEWITDAYGNVMCSECGWCAPKIMKGCLANRHLDYEKSEFCWHCGAYMGGMQG